MYKRQREYLNKIESGKMKPSKELLETLYKELARFNPEAPLTMLFDYVKISFPTLEMCIRDRPDMAQSFGTLEYAGESDHVFDRDKDNRRFFARRSYNLYSDVQRGENVVVEIPVQAGEKKFQYEQKVKIVNPKLYGRGYAIGDMGHTDYVLVADDIVAVEEK